MQIITDRQFESALKRIERANLKVHGSSLTACSMGNHTHDLIYEIRDKNLLVVVDDWRQQLKQRFLKVETITPLHCPDWARTPDDIVGCGSANIEGPDGEGLYDCLDCGIWFTKESATRQEG